MPKRYLLKTTTAFGNRAEELYFGLLKVRRLGLGLALVRQKVNLPGVFRLRQSNEHLLNIQHPHIQATWPVEAFAWLASFLAIIFFVFGRCLGAVFRLLRCPLRNNLLIEWAYFTINHDRLWSSSQPRFHRSLIGIDWEREFATRLGVSHTARDRLDYSFPELKDRKFVCLHVRTGDFFSDHSGSHNRNANIENYMLAAQWLIEQGYVVVRLGDCKMPKVKPMDGFLEYSHCGRKSEAWDVALIEHCDFYIGSQSGPLDTAMLFEKTILVANGVHISGCHWFRSGSLFLPKSIVKDGRRVSLKTQLIEHIFDFSGNADLPEGFTYQENTPSEILQAVKNLVHILPLNTEQIAFNLLWQETLLTLMETEQLYSPQSTDTRQKYRWGSRIMAVQGSVCPSYLASDGFEADDMDKNSQIMG